MIQKNITGPLAEGVSSGSLFSSIGSFFGFHSGGMGSEPTFVRLAPNPALLPRYHGGLGPGERYSITRDDEMILTPGQQKRVIELARGSAGAPTEVKVEVINQTGQDVKISQTRATADLQQMVVTLWMDAANRNAYGLRSMLGG